MQQELYQHTFPNGLTLLAERMPHVRSVTMYFMIPAGYVYEPAELAGTTSALSVVLTRGAGDRDSEELTNALDNLGVDRGESAGGFNITLSAGTLARNLPEMLKIYADIVQKPWLPDDELDPTKELLLQDLQALQDSPSDLCFQELKKRYYPSPYSRSHYGTEEGIAALTPEGIREFHKQRFRPNGAVLSIAGNIDWASTKKLVEELFGSWTGTADPLPPLQKHTRTSSHITKETQQTQIAIAFPAAAFGTPDYYPARGAVGVLSGGMGARLFTEVREKRGLCYSVTASYDNVREQSAILCYAGTRPDRAQQTLDVTIGELKRLSQGIEVEEIERVRAGLKTSLIMQQESTSARAASMGVDWFYLQRVRRIDEVQASIDGLTPKAVLDYLEKYPPNELTVVTLGPEPLKL